MPEMTAKIFDSVVTRLSVAGVSSPRLEARILIATALNALPETIDPYCLILDSTQLDLLERLLTERVCHKPLCKIVGQRAFYKSDFMVNENVLSPRPDTETLVEAAIALVQENQRPRILDLGTGSGCILLSILGDCPGAFGVGVDASASALQVAVDNARSLALSARTDFLLGSWFDDQFVNSLGSFDLVVSNPPYIPSAEIANLDIEVRDYDPLSALDGGADGFRDYRRQAEIILSLLNSGGYILLEAGIGQASEIAAIFVAKGLKLIKIIPDLSGIERCVILKK